MNTRYGSLLLGVYGALLVLWVVVPRHKAEKRWDQTTGTHKWVTTDDYVRTPAYLGAVLFSPVALVTVTLINYRSMSLLDHLWGTVVVAVTVVVFVAVWGRTGSARGKESWAELRSRWWIALGPLTAVGVGLWWQHHRPAVATVGVAAYLPVILGHQQLVVAPVVKKKAEDEKIVQEFGEFRDRIYGLVAPGAAQRFVTTPHQSVRPTRLEIGLPLNWNPNATTQVERGVTMSLPTPEEAGAWECDFDHAGLSLTITWKQTTAVVSDGWIEFAGRLASLCGWRGESVPAGTVASVPERSTTPHTLTVRLPSSWAPTSAATVEHNVTQTLPPPAGRPGEWRATFDHAALSVTFDFVEPAALPTNVPFTWNDEIADGMRHFTMRVGAGANGPAVWKMEGEGTPHMLIVGVTGTGKSSLLNLLTLQGVLAKWDVTVIDPKGGVAFNWFTTRLQTLQGRSGARLRLHNLENSSQGITEVLKDMRARYAALQNDPTKNSIYDIPGYRPHLVIIDELASEHLKASRDAIRTLTKEAREAGIFIAAAIQVTNAGTELDSATKSNFALRLLLGSPKADSVRMVYGTGVGPLPLPAIRMGLARLGTEADAQPIQLAYPGEPADIAKWINQNFA